MQKMPNPVQNVTQIVEQGKAERRDIRRLGALVLAELRHQTVLLEQLVALGEYNKQALDAMQQPEADQFSVRGLAAVDEEDNSSPFIGG